MCFVLFVQACHAICNEAELHVNGLAVLRFLSKPQSMSLSIENG
jgi:hypothetical protein